MDHWKKIRAKKRDKLIFIHIPKCGGTYVASILNDLNIKNKGHTLAVENEGINFTIIRDPVQRFESLLNYRLGENNPRNDWPSHLNYIYNDKSISLNEIVNKMTDEEITSFYPYSSLVYWSKDIDIFITIDQLKDFLNFFGYQYNPNKYNKINVSKKERGTFDGNTKKRISEIFKNDVILFQKICG